MSFSNLLCRIGLPKIWRQINQRSIPVLMYHGVLPDDDPIGDGDWLQVRCSEFSAQMAYLRRYYEPVSLIDALNNNLSYSTKPFVVITFDDGYANNLNYAYPILQKFDVPATIFLATAFINTRRLFWWDRLHLSLSGWGAPTISDISARLKQLPPKDIDQALETLVQEITGESPLAGDAAPDSYRALTVDEIHYLNKSGGIDFGSHTHGHEILEHLSDTQLIETLSNANHLLSSWGVKTQLFAAPNGSYLDRQIPFIKQAGLRCCVSTAEGLWRPPEALFRIPRIGIGRDMPIEKFALNISGVLHDLRFWKN
ncbi:MAG: polysaccharide deacetylase family protein [Azonexus sp.]|nr:polysaccharide deacetylase family protein [Azonexus sp.]